MSWNYADIQQTWPSLLNQGIGIEVLEQSIVKDAPNSVNRLASKLFISLLDFVAKNERNKIRERQAQGIAIAK